MKPVEIIFIIVSFFIGFTLAFYRTLKTVKALRT